MAAMATKVVYNVACALRRLARGQWHVSTRLAAGGSAFRICSPVCVYELVWVSECGVGERLAERKQRGVLGGQPFGWGF